MNPLKVTRVKKETKSKTLSIRLTESEMADFDSLKEGLKFGENREFVLFSFDVLKNIANWDSEGYKFYIRNPDSKDLKEVEFELYG